MRFVVESKEAYGIYTLMCIKVSLLPEGADPHHTLMIASGMNALNMEWRNGYVSVPDNHPDSGHNGDELNVHRGVTYFSRHADADGLWTFGFDTAAPSSLMGGIWSVDMIRAECIRLADQLEQRRVCAVASDHLNERAAPYTVIGSHRYRGLITAARRYLAQRQRHRQLLPAVTTQAELRESLRRHLNGEAHITVPEDEEI